MVSEADSTQIAILALGGTLCFGLPAIRASREPKIPGRDAKVEVEGTPCMGSHMRHTEGLKPRPGAAGQTGPMAPRMTEDSRLAAGTTVARPKQKPSGHHSSSGGVTE
jgi:hypothetical protein